MPFYTAMTQEGLISDAKKVVIAEEIVQIHTSVMRVPRNFVRTVFLEYPKGSGFTAGLEAPTAAVTCILRVGHSDEDKAALLKRIWALFQEQAGIATEQLAISLQEVAASDAMEMGTIMQGVKHA
jgi:phenylpyruvate tautomerase PptA (4-oxalocrotonate tautomerase family)